MNKSHYLHYQEIRNNPAYRLAEQLADLEAEREPALCSLDCHDEPGSKLSSRLDRLEEMVDSLRPGDYSKKQYSELKRLEDEIEKLKAENNYLCNKINEHIDRARKGGGKEQPTGVMEI